jgi:hypothetical protein
MFRRILAVVVLTAGPALGVLWVMPTAVAPVTPVAQAGAPHAQACGVTAGWEC